MAELHAAAVGGQRARISKMTTPDSLGAARYFQLHESIKSAVQAARYTDALRFVKASIPLIPVLVRDTKRRFGTFDILESEAVLTGGKLMAALGDVAGLQDMHRVLSSMPETREWADHTALRIADVELSNQLLALVSTEPGTIQSSLKSRFSSIEPERMRELCAWLNRVGRLRREEKGNSYALYRP